ncbi:MAG: anthranilate synthase component I [Acidobacteria bacterium]|nr:MAG: anthranilate synthase component I [Acidobacteriota bacterium]
MYSTWKKENVEQKMALVPVIEKMAADLFTPLAVYLKLADDGDDSFLLESVDGGENLARYSFIGVNPRMNIRSTGDETVVAKPEGTTLYRQNAFEFLREQFSKTTIESGHDLPAFSGGAIGYFDFDCVECFEPTLKREAFEGPLAEFMFFDSVIAFDHVRQTIHIVTLSSDESDEFPSGEFALEKNRVIRERLESGIFKLPAELPTYGNTEVMSNFTAHDFEDAVRKVKELINAGECYQVVLSQRFERRTNASPVSIYRAIRSLNPSPYMFLLQIGGKSVIGASPEMLVRCREDNLEYRPIAGTRPRGKDALEDRELGEEMQRDPKEVAEHMMLVDLGRNDLGRVSEFGSVKVDRLMEVEKYSHVQHLVSQLSAKLRSDKDQVDALSACFPAGTVSGAPKVRAIEIIRDLEPDTRGVYAGAVGYFDHAGNMDTCIAIRTLVLENGVAKIQAGAGIVADSVPELEYQETVNKARAMIRAIEIAEGR